MGLLTDFFLAPAKDVAGKPGSEVEPWKFKRRLEGKGCDTLQVEALAKLVGVELELVPSDEEGEQWLFALPPQFTKVLAKLDDKKRKKVSSKWEGSSDFFEKLCDLARESEETRTPMWFWMSL